MEPILAASAHRRALIIDDLAADRMLAHHCLVAAGWTTELARGSAEAWAVLERWNRDGITGVIVTDLHMPRDQLAQPRASTGAWLALTLRARMERGELPRLPIIALTALSEQEAHLSARAFGCDAVLSKPATLQLAERIDVALALVSTGEHSPAGADAMLGLLRHTLADTLDIATPRRITEQHLTRALLAYRRRGLAGLGETELAILFAPSSTSPLARGTAALARLSEAIEHALALGFDEAARLLAGELRDEETPAAQSYALGLSLSEYYRRRREAINVLLDIIAS